MPRFRLSRRDLIVAGGTAAGALLSPRRALSQGTPAAGRPVAVASANGLAAVKLAVARMTAGEPPVDAAVEGVGLVEADPDDITVGYGGIPNENGVVQLDAAVMDGSTMRAGAVAALEGIMHPSQVARDVMRSTTRILLVGEGALKFARARGYEEMNLLTDRARKIWLFWRENASAVDDWMAQPSESDDPDVHQFVEKYGSSYFPHGTIHLSACTGTGAVGCCTTTSGLFFKLAGRVGDSPLIGCGLYCDSEVGSAGATGHGESCIISNGAHTVVELMRSGKSPEEACLAALERIARNTRVPWLLDDDGRPRNNVSLYAVNTAGVVGAATTWSGGRHAVCRAGSEPELKDSAYLYRRTKVTG